MLVVGSLPRETAQAKKYRGAWVPETEAEKDRREY